MLDCVLLLAFSGAFIHISRSSKADRNCSDVKHGTSLDMAILNAYTVHGALESASVLNLSSLACYEGKCRYVKSSEHLDTSSRSCICHSRNDCMLLAKIANSISWFKHVTFIFMLIAFVIRICNAVVMNTRMKPILLQAVNKKIPKK